MAKFKVGEKVVYLNAMYVDVHAVHSTILPTYDISAGGILYFNVAEHDLRPVSDFKPKEKPARKHGWTIYTGKESK